MGTAPWRLLFFLVRRVGGSATNPAYDRYLAPLATLLVSLGPPSCIPSIFMYDDGFGGALLRVRSASYPLDAIIKGAPTNPSSLQIVKVSLFGVVRRYS